MVGDGSGAGEEGLVPLPDCLKWWLGWWCMSKFLWMFLDFLVAQKKRKTWFVLDADRRRKRTEKKNKKKWVDRIDFVFRCYSTDEESGRRRRSRVVFLFEANLFSSVGIVPVFVVCGFQGKKISIQEEQTKVRGGFFFFWIVTMRMRTRTLVDRRGRASYDCVINSDTEMAEICRNFLR